MNFTSFVCTLATVLEQYFPEELDPSLKPIDSADCLECRQMKFDFIIVGGGAAGCTLANRLSKNQQWKILLIEAGDDENYISDVPALQTKLFDTRFDWNFTTIKQNACLNKNGFCAYHQGHCLGGSSVINTMRYIRGNRADFDDWAAHGNDGWSYAEVLPYFLKAENNSIPDLMDSPYHSTEGPLCISHSNYQNDNPLLKEFLKAGNEFGLETLDYNGEQQIAVDYLQSTIRDGTTRCSTAKAYLEPIRYRENLYIFKNTLVTRIIFDETNRTAIGVECYGNGEYFTITATKEVILTAGAINTPKLLMLSGVGPRRHLEELGIPVIADLPVGETLYDHIYLALNFTICTRLLETFNETSYDIIVDYAKNRDGMLTTANGVEIVAFINQKRSTNSPPDVEILMGPHTIIDSNQNFSIPFLTIAVVKLKPKSIGTVKLQSRNFLVPPLIDPNYFSNSEDIEITKWAIGEIRELTNTPSLLKYHLKLITKDVENLCGLIDLNNDTDVECFIKFGSRSLGHPVSTCRMGKTTDETSVVDPSLLKVHGFANLRIAGSPIFYDMVRGHTLATTVMTAEKLSDIILSGYHFKP